MTPPGKVTLFNEGSLVNGRKDRNGAINDAGRTFERLSVRDAMLDKKPTLPIAFLRVRSRPPVLHERDDIAFWITHVEIEPAPRLSDEPLGKVHAARFVFVEQRFHICHFYRGQNQRLF